METYMGAIIDHQHQNLINSQFRSAVMAGEMADVEYFVLHGADVNARAPHNSSTPLFSAIAKQEYEVAEYLLSQGAASNDVVQTSGALAGYTPLHVVCRENDLHLAKLLIEEYKADVNAVADDGAHPIHFAVMRENVPLVKLLLEANADVNAEYNKTLYKKLFPFKQWSDVNCKNYSLLVHAIVSKNLSLVYSLVNFGANFFTIYNTKKMALFYAIESKSPSIVEFLLERIKKVCENVYKNEKMDLKRYLDRITFRGFQPIHLAVLLGNAFIVKLLLNAGADPNAQFKRVHYTKYLGYKKWCKDYVSKISLLTHASITNDLPVITVLKEYQAELTIPDNLPEKLVNSDTNTSNDNVTS